MIGVLESPVILLRCHGRTGLRWLVLLAVAALLLVAHGCHGDEDHELAAISVPAE